MDDLLRLGEIAEPLLAAIGERGRRQLAIKIGRSLRASQASRIAKNQNPDGSPFAPRKPRLRSAKGRLKRRMFMRIASAKRLKSSSDSDGAIVSFTDQSTRRIAQVHQYGLRAGVQRGSKAMAQYPARQLLGFSDQDRENITDLLIQHLQVV